MRIIKEIEDFGEFLASGYSFQDTCFQKIDFTRININWDRLTFTDCVFLGCKLESKVIQILTHSGCLIFPEIKGLPFDVYRSELYTWKELYKTTSPSSDTTVDEKIYEHFNKNKHNGNILEHLFQRLHDHSIDDGLRDLLRPLKNGKYRKKCIAIMGGHGTKRDDKYYKLTAKTSYLLAQRGFFMGSGGGPGIMEAANLGAYMANYGPSKLEDALAMLNGNFHFSEDKYHQDALEVIRKFPNGKDNLAIPTWFYGHEPSNLFASHIAKYFSNSIREDTLLAIALHGIVFAPGSAGTIQEIFMDAAQNHYGTFTYLSPMVFLGKEHYIKKTGIYPLLQNLSKDKPYGKLLYTTDRPEDIAAFLSSHQPLLADN